jgi:hypothetical protein
MPRDKTEGIRLAADSCGVMYLLAKVRESPLIASFCGMGKCAEAGNQGESRNASIARHSQPSRF